MSIEIYVNPMLSTYGFRFSNNVYTNLEYHLNVFRISFCYEFVSSQEQNINNIVIIHIYK